jgi:hypothetical protein
MMLFSLNYLLLKSLGIGSTDHQKVQWLPGKVMKRPIRQRKKHAEPLLCGHRWQGFIAIYQNFVGRSVDRECLITSESHDFRKNRCKGRLPGKVYLSRFLDKGVPKSMLAGKAHLSRKTQRTAMGRKCTAMLAGKAYLSRKSESTAGKLHSQIKTSLCSP